MNISTPVLSAVFTKSFNNIIDRNSGMLYNNNVGDSVTFSSARNRRYEKLSENELKIKKNKGGFVDISEQNFLDEFIKKYDIDNRSRTYAEKILKNAISDVHYIKNVFDVSDLSKLTISKKINYKLFPTCVLTKIPVLENNEPKFIINSEFFKDGFIHDTWLSKN